MPDGPVGRPALQDAPRLGASPDPPERLVDATHTSSVLVRERVRAFSRAWRTLLSARGYNIDTLSVAETLDPSVSCMTHRHARERPDHRADHQAAPQADRRDQGDRSDRGGLTSSGRWCCIKVTHRARDPRRGAAGRRHLPRQDRRRHPEVVHRRGDRRRQARSTAITRARCALSASRRSCVRGSRIARVAAGAGLDAARQAGDEETEHHGAQDLLRQGRTTSARSKGKTVAIIGYGSQGHAHALNLKDSRRIRGGGPAQGLAEPAPRPRAAGLAVMSVEEAARAGDIIMILLPDENHGRRSTGRRSRPSLRRASTSPWPTASTSTSGRSCPAENVNVFMVAPKGPGHLVRSDIPQGRGRARASWRSSQDPSEDTRQVAPRLRPGIGGGRAGIIETNFREETETDLFGEQAVLCGGLTASSRPASRRSSRRATRPRWPTSSACTR